MLIKFGEKSHMESLLDGNIYMNCMKYFKDCEDRTNIGDKDEGIEEILQSDHVKIKIIPKEYKKNEKTIKLKPFVYGRIKVNIKRFKMLTPSNKKRPLTT
jgi:hypothetical protein